MGYPNFLRITCPFVDICPIRKTARLIDSLLGHNPSEYIDIIEVIRNKEGLIDKYRCSAQELVAQLASSSSEHVRDILYKFQDSKENHPDCPRVYDCSNIEQLNLLAQINNKLRGEIK